MANKRPIISILLGVAALLSAAGKVQAGPFSGKVTELDGTTPVTDFTIEVFKHGTTAPATLSVPVTIVGNSYSFTVKGMDLPATNKTIRIEFVRGNTKRVVENLNGQILMAQVIDVTIGPRTVATPVYLPGYGHYELPVSTGECRHGLSGRRGLFRCRR